MDNQPPNNTRIIKANNLLKLKVGTGPIDARKLEQSQSLIDEIDVDFAPLAQEYLDSIKAIIADAKQDESHSAAEMLEDLTNPVMQLKANAGMFGYETITALTTVMLNFLEEIDTLDKTAIQIMEAHHQTLSIIISHKMTGDNGEQGAVFVSELKDAIKRYFNKNAG